MVGNSLYFSGPYRTTYRALSPSRHSNIGSMRSCLRIGWLTIAYTTQSWFLLEDGNIKIRMLVLCLWPCLDFRNFWQPYGPNRKRKANASWFRGCWMIVFEWRVLVTSTLEALLGSSGGSYLALPSSSWWKNTHSGRTWAAASRICLTLLE